MNRFGKNIVGFFGHTTPVTVAPPPQRTLPDSRAIEYPATPQEVAAAWTASGLGPNSQAPTRHHDMQGQRR